MRGLDQRSLFEPLSQIGFGFGTFLSLCFFVCTTLKRHVAFVAVRWTTQAAHSWCPHWRSCLCVLVTTIVLMEQLCGWSPTVLTDGLNKRHNFFGWHCVWFCKKENHFVHGIAAATCCFKSSQNNSKCMLTCACCKSSWEMVMIKLMFSFSAAWQHISYCNWLHHLTMRHVVKQWKREPVRPRRRWTNCAILRRSTVDSIRKALD